MRLLGVDELVQLADLAVGGRAEIRDLGLLASAAGRPSSGYGDYEAYPTIHEKVAALLHSLVSNHALIDGNKRLGWVGAVVLYDINGWDLDAPDDAAYDLVIGVATGELDVPLITPVLRGWAQERPH